MQTQFQEQDSATLSRYGAESLEHETVKNEPRFKKNLGNTERLVTGMLGGSLLLYGLMRPLALRGQVANLSGLGLLARSLSGHCPFYQRLGIDTSPLGYAEHKNLMAPHPYVLHERISVGRPLEDVYAFCRDLTMAQTYIPVLKRVQILNPAQAQLTFGSKQDDMIKVDVETFEEIPKQQISWRLLPASKMDISVSARFSKAPRERGTEIQVSMHITPPVGALGSVLFKAISPFNQVLLSQTLHRMKQYMETGEISTIEGQASGRSVKPHMLRDIQDSMSQKLRKTSVRSLNAERSMA